MEVIDRIANAVNWPDDELASSHQDGCTEGWIAEAVASMLKASGARVVLELGGFQGTTSAWLLHALNQLGGGVLFVSEPDHDRAEAIRARLSRIEFDRARTDFIVDETPSPAVIGKYAEKSIGFAFVDDDHQKHHVEQEINALWSKMKPGGLMLFHDVASDGVCQLGPLIRKYGGVALDFPRLGPDGGLGIIPIPK